MDHCYKAVNHVRVNHYHGTVNHCYEILNHCYGTKYNFNLTMGHQFDGTGDHHDETVDHCDYT